MENLLTLSGDGGSGTPAFGVSFFRVCCWAEVVLKMFESDHGYRTWNHVSYLPVLPAPRYYDHEKSQCVQSQNKNCKMFREN